jgi:single-stranded DNA-binding protein
MNDINSVIVEGEMGTVPNDDGKCYVIVTRTFKNDLGEKETTRTHFFVVIKGRLAEMYADKFKRGRKVRIVGRLQNDNRGRAEIFAEHIEFKPIFETAENN